jgi:hypothetical protein
VTKRGLIILLCLCGPIVIFVAQAQDNPIEYGQTVTGTMNLTGEEIRYVFAGRRDDIVIFELKAIDPFGQFDTPILTLLEGYSNKLIDTTNAFGFREALLAAELPKDALFTIMISRLDNETAGDFTLEMIQPTTLTFETPVAAEISSEDRNQYYVAQADSEFNIKYTKDTGNFFPQVAINRINASSGGLKQVAVMAGEELTQATLGSFQANTTYVIVVGEAPLDYSGEEVTTDYEILMVPSE